MNALKGQAVMRIACCQLDIAWEDKAANYRRVEALVDAAHLPPGTLLLLPEMFATGFTMNAQAVAEPLDGPTARFLSDLARTRQLIIQAGVVIRASGDSSGVPPSGGIPAEAGTHEPGAHPRNEALVFDAAGRFLARYAKMHLFSFAGEPAHYAPGESAVVYHHQNTAIAPAICYDLRFPELFRRAVQDRAEVLSIIACWPAPREEHWLALLRARAIENQCHVAAVNRCGRDPSGLAYGGRSQIIDPRGVVLADAGNQECVIQSEIDLEAQQRYRHEFPALSDMRL